MAKQGSYPNEITADQFAWLNERAAARCKRWADHASSLACNQKSPRTAKDVMQAMRDAIDSPDGMLAAFSNKERDLVYDFINSFSE